MPPAVLFSASTRCTKTLSPNGLIFITGYSFRKINPPKADYLSRDKRLL
jgi:hypothetical protein